MPYQPTNPYPYNTAIDSLEDGLQFHFKVDNYDTIESFKIELYDYLKNKKIYTIVRTTGDIQFKSVFTYDKPYILEINETQETVVLYKENDIRYPVNNLNGTLENFKVEIQNYEKGLQEKINDELNRMSNATLEKKIIQGNTQLIQVLDENDEQLLLKKYTKSSDDFMSELPIKGGLGIKSIGEVDVTPFLGTMEAIERKRYYGDTDNYKTLTITNVECFKVDDTGTIVEYIEENNTTNKAEIVIPYKVSEKIVKKIKANVFKDNTNITSVIIPSCVTTISNKAFYNCVNLQNVYLNYGITKIGEACFAECHNLSSINLLDSINEIGNEAFQNCEGLLELRLPWSLIKINKYTFSNVGITNLELPLNLEIIEEGGFLKCNKLEKIVCNSKLKQIKKQAFGNCVALKEVILNDHLEGLGEEVFLNCENLMEITIPKYIQFIETAILKGCIKLITLIIPFIGSKNTKLEDDILSENRKKSSVLGYFFGEQITGEESNEEIEVIEQYYDASSWQKKNYLIPKNLLTVEITNTTFIPYGAFSNCVNIREIKMNDEVTNIQDYGFYNCVKISKIKLSSNLTYIGNYAFALAEPKNLG